MAANGFGPSPDGYIMDHPIYSADRNSCLSRNIFNICHNIFLIFYNFIL